MFEDLLTVVALAMILVLALSACGKNDGGGEAKAKYEGETAEKVLMDKLVVKYPAAFVMDEDIAISIFVLLDD